jgi:hypothetical protein
VDLLPLQRALPPPTAVRGQASTLGGPSDGGAARPARICRTDRARPCAPPPLARRAYPTRATPLFSCAESTTNRGLPITVPSIHSCVSHLIRCQSVGKSLAYSCGLFSDQERLAPRLSSVLLTRVACFHLNPLIRLVVIDLLIPI